jgi:hypothetical protein
LRNLIGFWDSVGRGTALYNICYVNFLSGKAHGFNNFVKELASASHKRESLFILVGSGAFSDKHQTSLWVSASKNDFISFAAEPATGTGTEPLLDAF